MTPIFSRTSADAIGKTLNVLVETIAPEASAAGVVYSPKLSPLGSAEGLFLGNSKSENVPRLAQVVDMITARCPKNELITPVIAFLRAEIRATSCELENSGDGTLIEAWASLKSFKRRDGAPPFCGLLNPRRIRVSPGNREF